MTYDEIKKRLTEVETTLQSMQKIKSAQLETSYTAKSINNLNTLKESLQKQLAEKEETMFVSTKGGDTKAVQMDRKTAMDLKKDPNITGIDTAKGQSLKELDRLDKNSGIEFDQNETGKIAVEVGKALAISLKKAGDELARMKAKRIEPNSFDVEVVYKGEKGMDEFSFYIIDDSLHLVDFSFDKELVDVGVKPSGEPIINRDVLANELLKHFKSLNEEEVNEVNYDHYTEPKHFDICPGAEALRDEVLASGKTPEELGEWTFKHDELFRLEKAVLKANKADDRHVKVAKDLAGEITHHSRDLGIEANKIGYLKGHIKKIEDVAKKTDGRGDNMSLRSRDIYEGEGDDHHYLKVSRRDYKKAMSILDKNVDATYVKMDVVDDDGAGNVVIYFIFRHEYGFDDMYDDPEGKENPEFYQEPDEDPHAFIYDVVMDLQSQDIDVVDHSADMDEDYDPDQMQKDDEEDHGVAYDDDGRPLGEDLDVGHQDDEPGMLKSTSYEIATYAAKLYKKLAQYDQVDGEVDFPNWWQSKLILAKDYVSKAYHYLDSEEKQPIIDKLALEHALSEGTELYDRNGINIKRFSGGKRGLMVQVTYGGEYIQIPADEFPILARAMQSVIGDLRDMNVQYPRSKNVGEALDSDLPKNLSAAKLQKAHGMIVDKMKELAKLYKEKGGDHEYRGHSVMDHLKSLTKKKKQVEAALEKAVAGIGKGQQLAEVTEDEVQDAIMDLRNLIDEIDGKAEEAREIVRQVFPNELSRLDAYGAFNAMNSANRYDVTLGGFVDRLEEEGFEIEDGEVFTLEGDYKSDAQRKAIYAAKAEKNELKDTVDNREIENKIIEFAKGGTLDIRITYHRNKEKVVEGISVEEAIKLINQYIKQTDLTQANISDESEDILLIDDGNTSIDLYRDGSAKYNEALQLVHVYDKDGKMYGTGSVEKVEGDKTTVRFDGSTVKRFPSDRVKPVKEAELSKDEKKKLKDMSKSLKKSSKGHAGQAKYLDKITKEAAPGYKHDCAAKVVHETYGVGICIPEKHTLIKEGSKYVVTHYDVLFESGETVEDIPVSELEIKTQKEHWHKGYKKKKK